MSLSNRNPLRVARSLLRHLEAQGVIRPQIPPQEDYEGRQEWETEFLTKNGRAATEKDWYDFTREPADISEIDAEPETQRTAQAGPWSQRTHPEGFRVVPDPDQEGMWIWRYLPDGSAHACGSDISFDSESEAWIDAAREHRKCEAQAGPWNKGIRPAGVINKLRQHNSQKPSYMQFKAYDRLGAALRNPCSETWDDVKGLCIARGRTLWQLILEVDPTFTRRGKATDAAGNVLEDWPQVPSSELMARAIEHGIASASDSERNARLSNREGQAGPWSAGSPRPLFNYDTDAPCGHYPHHAFQTTFTDSSCTVPIHRFCHYCQTRHIYRNGRWYYDNPRFCQSSKRTAGFGFRGWVSPEGCKFEADSGASHDTAAGFLVKKFYPEVLLSAGKSRVPYASNELLKRGWIRIVADGKIEGRTPSTYSYIREHLENLSPDHICTVDYCEKYFIGQTAADILDRLDSARSARLSNRTAQPETVKTPLNDLVSEHTKLVQVLKRDDPKEIAEEAKDQGRELAGYKEKVAARLSSPSIEKRVALAMLDHLERKGQAGPWNNRPRLTQKQIVDRLINLGLVSYTAPAAERLMWSHCDPNIVVPHSEHIVNLLNSAMAYIDWKDGTMPHIQDVVTGFGLPEYVEPKRTAQAGPWSAEPKGDVSLKCYGKGEEVAFRYPKDIEEMCSWCGSHSHVWIQSDRGDARQVKITGKVRRWKTDTTRVEIPWKYGMYEYGVLRGSDLQSLLIPIGNKYIGQSGPWNKERKVPDDRFFCPNCLGAELYFSNDEEEAKCESGRLTCHDCGMDFKFNKALKPCDIRCPECKKGELFRDINATIDAPKFSDTEQCGDCGATFPARGSHARRGQAGPWNAERRVRDDEIEKVIEEDDQANPHYDVRDIKELLEASNLECMVYFGNGRSVLASELSGQSFSCRGQMIRIAQSGPWNANRPKPQDGDAKHDAWIEKYRPIKNTIDPNANMDGTMFETLGEELAFVRAQDPQKIWTLVDGDGHQIISAGFHFVNREGYFITEVPWTDENEYVDLDEGRAQCPECGDFTDDFTGNCQTDDCQYFGQKPPQAHRGIRLSNRTAQTGPWNKPNPMDRRKGCVNCQAPIDPSAPYGREGFCCSHCYYHYRGQDCPVDDCPECYDDNPEPEAEEERNDMRQAQAGPWNKENAGRTQERWVFTDGEFLSPRLCKRSDEFEAVMPDSDFSVIVNRMGTAQGRWSDGTLGASSGYSEMAESQDILFSVEHRAYAEIWRDVICDKDGKFVRFVPE